MILKSRNIVSVLLVIGLVLLFSCKKQDLSPNENFTAKIDNVEKKLTDSKINIDKGITILAGVYSENKQKSTLVITVHGDREGEYVQDYDYITGVSVKECGMTQKSVSGVENVTEYFSSFEGKVIITDINTKEKRVSGKYSFKLKAMPDTKNEKTISGNFENLKYK